MRVPPGVIYLRSIPTRPDEPAAWLISMARQLVIEGNFTIFSGWEHVRQRPMPSG